MNVNRFIFSSAAGCPVYAWKSEVKNPKIILQIVHGMSEHKERYLEFAEYCAEKNIMIYIHDHLGHGETAGSVDKIGTIPAKHAWQKMKDDVHSLSNIVREEHPDLPHFLLGFSMGAFMVRSLLLSGYCDYKGIILAGNPANPGIIRPVGALLAKMVIGFKGRDYAGPMLHNIAYANNNKKFKPAKTDFDWLSRDLSVGEKFASDPFCGRIFSAGFYNNLAFGAKKLFSPLKQAFVPTELPILMLSGSDDPVGSGPKGCKQVYKVYKRAGLENLSKKIYPGARHEIINETNKEEVYRDIHNWVNSIIDEN